MVVRTISANNGTGLAAVAANATLRFSNTVVTGNNVSWSATAGSTFLSYGDNNIDGNADANPAPTTTALK